MILHRTPSNIRIIMVRYDKPQWSCGWPFFFSDCWIWVLDMFVLCCCLRVFLLMFFWRMISTKIDSVQSSTFAFCGVGDATNLWPWSGDYNWSILEKWFSVICSFKFIIVYVIFTFHMHQLDYSETHSKNIGDSSFCLFGLMVCFLLIMCFILCILSFLKTSFLFLV